MKRTSTIFAVFLLMLCATILLSSRASAQFFNEDFDYTVGDSLRGHGWIITGTSTVNTIKVTTPGLTYTNYIDGGVGNAATLANNGQDLNKGFTNITSGTVYASLLVDVTASQIGSYLGDYFFHMTQGLITSNIFYGRLFERSADNGKLAFGITKTSLVTGIPTIWSDSVYNLNTTYLIVVKYKFNTGSTTNDQVSLFVFADPSIPAAEPATPAVGPITTTQTDATGLDLVNLRQGSATLAPGIIVDGIRIDTTWNGVLVNLGPSALITPASLNFNKVNLGESATDTISVTNVGSQTLDITSASSSDPVFAVSPGSASLAHNATQKFAVTFTPTNPVVSSAKISFVSNAYSSPDSVIVSGSGTQAGFLMAPTNINFGNVFKDSTKTDSVAVTNTGTTAHLIIDSVRSSNPLFTITPTSADLDTSSTKTFTISFAPTAAGAVSANIVFYHNAASKIDTLKLTGNCILKAPLFLATPATLNLKGVLVGQSRTDSVTVKNTGYDSLFINTVTSSDPTFTITPTSARIDSQASKKFYITFTPTAAGTKGASIVFASNVTELNDTIRTSARGITVVPISEVRKDVNGDLIADHSVTADTLASTGIITSLNFGASYPQTAIFIQDTSGGVEIFSWDLSATNFVVGDSVLVVGTVAQYHGLTEYTPVAMDSLHFGLLKHNAVVPKTKHLTLHQYVTSAESYEGQLVEVDTLYKASGTWPVAGSSASIYLTNVARTDTMQMYIDLDTDVDGSTEPQYPINVVGIASQYSSGTTVSNGYEILPRDSTDISKTKIAPSVSIAEARKDANSDLIADHSTTHDTLAVHGVITSPNFTPSQTVYALQDSTAGIVIISTGPSPTNFVIGDSVVVVGTVSQDRGLAQFTPLAMTDEYFGLLKHDAVVPKPKRVTLHQYVTNGENYEGQLIEIDTLYKVSGTWPASGVDGNIYLSKATKTDSVLMFIDQDTHIDGTTELQYPINVIGIARQFTSAAIVYNDGYQIVPRDTSDIHHQTVVSVRDPYAGIPTVYELHNNYPNPFNPSTTILYGLPQLSKVTLKVYSVLGQEMMTLVNEVQSPSYYRVVWNGTDKGGAQVSSGVYFFRIVAEPMDGKTQPFMQVKKMLLMK